MGRPLQGDAARIYVTAMSKTDASGSNSVQEVLELRAGDLTYCAKKTADLRAVNKTAAVNGYRSVSTGHTMERIAMNKRFWISMVVYVLWVIITLTGAKWLLGGEEAGLDELVKNGIGWQFVGAIVLLLAAIAAFKWRDMRFGKPHSLLKVMWFPVLVLLAISALALVTGLPEGKVIFYVAFNTFLVGVSEEVMFRGVMFRSLLENVKVWVAIIATTVLFGAVHVLNGFTTGEWGLALNQAVAAGMSGLIFIAIVIRTESLWPAIIYHFLWDCMLFLIGAASAARTDASADPALEAAMAGGSAVLLPLLLALPNFLCALILLRKVNDASFREKKEVKCP